MLAHNLRTLKNKWPSVAEELQRTDPEGLEALLADWRFTCPTFEDHAVRCVRAASARDGEGVQGYLHDYSTTWWTRVVCEAFDRVWLAVEGREGGVGKLAVVLPLQHGKSLHGEVLASGLLGRKPTLRGGVFGYRADFGKRTIRHVHSIMRGQAFRDTYPDVWPGLPPDLSREQRLELASNLPSGADAFAVSYRAPHGEIVAGGSLVAGSWPTPPNGLSLDFLILDDPYRRWKDVYSHAYEQDLRTAYTGTLSRRLQGSTSVQVLCFTPWTDRDVFSFILDVWEKEGDPFEVVRLPALPRADTAEERRWGGRGYDPRSVPEVPGEDDHRQDGRDDERVAGEGQDLHGAQGTPPEPLCPGAWGSSARGLAWYRRTKRGLSEREWRAHYLLDVSSTSDELFARSWWTYHDPSFSTDACDLVFLSLDANAALADGGNEGDSFAVCGAYGVQVVPEDEVGRTRLHRLGEYRARPSYDELVEDLLAFADRNPAASVMIVEAAAAGRQLLGTGAFVRGMERRGIRVVSTQHVYRELAEKAKSSRWSEARKAKVERWSAWLGQPKPARQATAIPYVRAGRLSLPRGAAWLTTENDPGTPWDVRLGFLDELALGVSPDDRRDEVAQSVAFAEAWAEPRGPQVAPWVGRLGSALRRR